MCVPQQLILHLKMCKRRCKKVYLPCTTFDENLRKLLDQVVKVSCRMLVAFLCLPSVIFTCCTLSGKNTLYALKHERTSTHMMYFYKVMFSKCHDMCFPNTLRQKKNIKIVFLFIMVTIVVKKFLILSMFIESFHHRVLNFELIHFVFSECLQCVCWRQPRIPLPAGRRKLAPRPGVR